MSIFFNKFVRKSSNKGKAGLYMSFNQEPLVFSNSQTLHYKNIAKTWQIGKNYLSYYIKEIHPKAKLFPRQFEITFSI